MLAGIVATYTGPTATRSEAEEQLLTLLDDAGLPRPRVNAWIALPEGGGYEADFLWTAHRLVVEVDGHAHHATKQAFVRDRMRDRRLAAAGYETRRYAASELVRAPGGVVSEIAAFLKQRTPAS